MQSTMIEREIERKNNVVGVEGRERKIDREKVMKE